VCLFGSSSLRSLYADWTIYLPTWGVVTISHGSVPWKASDLTNITRVDASKITCEPTRVGVWEAPENVCAPNWPDKRLPSDSPAKSLLRTQSPRRLSSYCHKLVPRLPGTPPPVGGGANAGGTAYKTNFLTESVEDNYRERQISSHYVTCQAPSRNTASFWSFFFISKMELTFQRNNLYR